jgi:hypothetical protein
MKLLLTSVACATLLLGAAVPAVYAQGTLTQPSTTGNGSVAPVTPPGGNRPGSSADANPTKPGATGNDALQGNNSTMRGDRAATYDQKSGVQSR